MSDVNPHPTTDFDNLTFSTSNEDIAKVEKDVASNVVRVTANHARRYGEAVISARNDVTGYYGMFTVLVKPNDGITVPVVAATNSGVYALKADGTVWTWGNTYDGSTSSTVNRTSPVRVVKNVGKDSTTYLENIKHIAAGPTHMLAVDTDGQVWALGNNANGKLGIGGTSTAYTPTLVKQVQQKYFQV